MPLCLDIECTTFNKGNAFDSRNYLVSIHAYNGFESISFKPDEMDGVRDLVNNADLIVFFNGKFDVAWLRKYGVNFEGKKLYDVQLAHYMLSNQTHKFPSLNEVCYAHGIPLKTDVVAQYWKDGVQTDQIPWDILCEYGEGDVTKTYQCFEKQLPLFSAKKQTLFNLACQDLLVLQEMENNGLFYDKEVCAQKSGEIQEKVGILLDKLNLVYPDVSINFNSNDQLSAFLYGGSIVVPGKEMVGFYKTGLKAGQPKYKNTEVEHQLPRLFEPLPKTEMDKKGVYSTAEGTLRKLKSKKNQWILDTLLELSKLTKLDETYYTGLAKLNAEMHWPPGYLHGQFNQCTTKTGRLSSSKPNLQNLSGDSLDIFITRYGT